MKTLLSIPTFLFSLILFTSCGSFNPFSSGSDPGFVSKEIGPEGGTITTPDGRLTLSIPEGALENTEAIAIEELNPDDLPEEYRDMQAVYELEPDGLTFDQPVSVFFEGSLAVISDDSGAGFPAVIMGLTSEQSKTSEIINDISLRKKASSNEFII